MKIRIADRILVALAGLILLLLAVCLLDQTLLPMGVTAWLQQLTTPVSAQPSHALYITAVIACVAVLVLLGLYCLGMLFRHQKKSKRGFVMQQTECGELSISVRAIEGLVQKCVDRHDEIHVMSTALDTTRDGQLSDIALDRWYYREMEAIAKASGSGFLEGFVRLQIDAANLRALVRTIRMGKNADFLKLVLLEGGHIAAEELLSVSAGKGSGLAELYAPTVFRAAAESGAAALGGGPLTEFEKRCDDAVSTYLSDARFVPFGEQAVLAYLAARETEYTNLHILLLGRSMGLDPEVIRSRLRESCV